MLIRVSDKFFSFARRIFFEGISTKFPAGSSKNLMDFLYVIFEKIAYKFDVLSSNYLKMYEEIVEKEIKMASISSEDVILVIGCGSLPATSALIAMETKARIVSIDKDHRAINEASKFIKTLNLENIIKLEHTDGLYFPVEKFDVIFVLYGVEPQKKILNYLSDNMKKTARIVFRTVSDLEDKIKDRQIDLSNMFVVKSYVRSESFGQVDSFLLLKKASV